MAVEKCGLERRPQPARASIAFWVIFCEQHQRRCVDEHVSGSIDVEVRYPLELAQTATGMGSAGSRRASRLWFLAKTP
jgi:hypothetical protein